MSTGRTWKAAEQRYFISGPCMSLERRSIVAASKVTFNSLGLSCSGSVVPMVGCRKLAACNARMPAPKMSCALILSLSPVPSNVTESMRSEEHTSELQSHLNLVCRLLLEKKKTSPQYT